MKNLIKGLGSAVSVAALSVAVSVPASAVLEEIIVTAQRRAENVQNVPISMSTMNGQELDDLFTSGEDVLALAGRIPSFHAESSNGRVAPRFYIRGLGNTDFDLAASQPVSMYIDEVVMENVVLKSTPLFDVSQVEVLRGPQGSLFGRNTSAGLIKFATNDPSQDREIKLNASYGTHNSVTVGAVMSGALTDRISARFALHNQRRSNWIDNAWTGEDNALGNFNEVATRFKLLFEMSDSTDLLLNVHTRDLEGTAAIFRANILGPNGFTSNYDRETVWFDGGNNNPQAYTGLGYSVKLRHAFNDNVEFTYIGAHEETDGFSRGDIDGGYGASFLPFMGPGFIPFPSDTQDDVAKHNQDTHELRLSSQGNDKVNWQMGAYFFDSDLTIDTNAFGCCSGQVVHGNKAWAVFGQAEVLVDDDFTVTAGLRHTDEEKDLVVTAAPLLFLITNPTKISDAALSWDLAFNWAATDSMNYYVRVADGFRGPSIQGRDVTFFGFPSTADSETNFSMEFGSKAYFMDGRMRLNWAFYKYELENQQVSAVGGADNGIRLVNIDKTDGAGFELDGEWQFSDCLTLDFGYSYNHTEIDDPNALVAVCGSGACTPQDPTVWLDTDPGPPIVLGEFAYIHGNPLPHAAKHIFNFVADYRVPAFDGREAFFTLDYFYKSDANALLYEAAEFNLDNQFELGLKTGIAGDDWELAFYAKNITDEHNLEGVIDFNNNTGFVNDPRRMGITFNATY